MRRNCPLENESARIAYNIQEAEMVGQVARTVPRIYAALKDHQEDRQQLWLKLQVRLMSNLFLF